MSQSRLFQIRRVFIYLTILALVFFGGYRFGQSNSGGEKGWLNLAVDSGSSGVFIDRSAGREVADFDLFWRVWDRMKEMYIDQEKLDEKQMIYSAIKGMVSVTKDPYTVFLTPEENQRAKDDLSGAFEGVGIQLGYKELQGANRLAVISPLEGMPAIKAGVKAGDLILKIDDVETTEMTLPEAVDKIRGEKGTTVTLALLSEGDEEPHEVPIVRNVINVPSVELTWEEVHRDDPVDRPTAESADGDSNSAGVIAHLKVTRFGEQTMNEWNVKVREILNYRQASVKGIVLDLRSNPGGFFQGAIDLGSDLVESGVLVQQEAADGAKQQYRANGSARLAKLPLIVLINQGSASAAEILAGALRELRQIKLVGEKTFGKGSVQEALDLENSAGLHVTTHRWLLPSGTSIDKSGINADVEIIDNPETSEVDEQLDKAIEVL